VGIPRLDSEERHSTEQDVGTAVCSTVRDAHPAQRLVLRIACWTKVYIVNIDRIIRPAVTTVRVPYRLVEEVEQFQVVAHHLAGYRSGHWRQ